jgi:hypothetical protein
VLAHITQDTTITALYDINLFTVTFVDFDGTVLKTEIVAFDGTATAPSSPTRTGHTFTGWDRVLTHITQDTTITALYDINLFTVTFVDFDGTVLKTEIVAFDGTATAPSSPTRTGHTFTGWDKAFDHITQDTTITALYDINLFTVTFVDFDGTVLKTEIVAFDGTATAPSSPSRVGHTFTGWDKAFDHITQDTTITARYEAIPAPKAPPAPAAPASRTTQSAPEPEPEPKVEPKIVEPQTPRATPTPRTTPVVPQPVVEEEPAPETSFALLNLIFAAFGVGTTAFSLIFAFRRKIYNARNQDNNSYQRAGNIESSRVLASVSEYKKSRLFTCQLIVICLAAVLGVVLFLLTEDITAKMIFADIWTWLNAVFFAIGLAAAVALICKRYEQAQKEQEEDFARSMRQTNDSLSFA